MDDLELGKAEESEEEEEKDPSDNESDDDSSQSLINSGEGGSGNVSSLGSDDDHVSTMDKNKENITGNKEGKMH
eukprot:15346061-Ditylum_brightwellii.AAC.1